MSINIYFKPKIIEHDLTYTVKTDVVIMSDEEDDDYEYKKIEIKELNEINNVENKRYIWLDNDIISKAHIEATSTFENQEILLNIPTELSLNIKFNTWMQLTTNDRLLQFLRIFQSLLKTLISFDNIDYLIENNVSNSIIGLLNKLVTKTFTMQWNPFIFKNMTTISNIPKLNQSNYIKINNKQLYLLLPSFTFHISTNYLIKQFEIETFVDSLPFKYVLNNDYYELIITPIPLGKYLDSTQIYKNKKKSALIIITQMVQKYIQEFDFFAHQINIDDFYSYVDQNFIDGRKSSKLLGNVIINNTNNDDNNNEENNNNNNEENNNNNNNEENNNNNENKNNIIGGYYDKRKHQKKQKYKKHKKYNNNDNSNNAFSNGINIDEIGDISDDDDNDRSGHKYKRHDGYKDNHRDKRRDGRDGRDGRDDRDGHKDNRQIKIENIELLTPSSYYIKLSKSLSGNANERVIINITDNPLIITNLKYLTTYDSNTILLKNNLQHNYHKKFPLFVLIISTLLNSYIQDEFELIGLSAFIDDSEGFEFDKRKRHSSPIASFWMSKIIDNRKQILTNIIANRGKKVTTETWSNIIPDNTEIDQNFDEEWLQRMKKF
jgi:hypothetical protein